MSQSLLASNFLLQNYDKRNSLRMISLSIRALEHVVILGVTYLGKRNAVPDFESA